MRTHDLSIRFKQRLTAVGGEFHHVENVTQAAEIIATHPALEEGAKDLQGLWQAPLRAPTGTLVIPPNFARTEPWGAILPILTNKGIVIHEVEDVASVADAAAGLSSAELAIAETGSVLIAENSLEARVVTMLTLTHFVLVREHDLVPMLDDAGVRLQQLTKAGPGQRHYISLITGPSRTADIERTLTIGVQGPKALCVIMVKA